VLFRSPQNPKTPWVKTGSERYMEISVVSRVY